MGRIAALISSGTETLAKIEATLLKSDSNIKHYPIEKVWSINFHFFFIFSQFSTKFTSNSFFFIKQRRCRFSNETDGNKKYKNIIIDRQENAYRRSTCVRACRLESIVTLCRCVPVYFDEIFRQRTGSKMCSFEDLPCLSRYAGISWFFSLQIDARISLLFKKSVETACSFINFNFLLHR